MAAKGYRGLTNPAKRKRFLQGIQLGMTVTLAAKYAGIDRTTVYAWLRKGEEQNKGRYREFLDAMQEAEGNCAASALASIHKAFKDGHWTAGAWILERRHGYTKTERQEVQAEVTMTVEQVVTEAEKILEDMSDDELERIANSA